MTDRAARRLALALLRRIQEGRLTIVEDGRPTVIGRGAPQATVVVRSPRFWPMLLRGGLGFGEAYVEGHWDTPDLTAVIELAARNLGGVDELRRRLTPVREPLQRGRALLTRNTPSRARSGIAAHYDLGNDLFSAMLDETMTYSCAVFERRDTSLADAQMAKLERICDKLAIDPGDRVLEIGTGWGSFALHAAATRGCHVTTTTLSQEQYGLAIARVADAGLSDRVTVLRDDYRELRGTFDKLVCIEMIEAVGWKDFGTFFEICARRLEPNGAMALQAITVDDRLYAMENASRTFIRTHVFPDGCLPSLEVIARSVARRSDLRMVALEDITDHYPETLRRWRENLDANAAELAARGYDDRFQRLWRLYLCWCELGFAMRRISDVQIVLGKPAWRGTVSVSDSRARTHCTARQPGRATGSRSTP
jgi:cyclopropane-fatty-acyl-phospholipid synthase